jgi:hypothetical protein
MTGEAQIRKAVRETDERLRPAIRDYYVRWLDMLPEDAPHRELVGLAIKVLNEEMKK